MLADYAWTYDDAGHVASTTSDDGTTTYSYDATWQLTEADHSYQTDEIYTYSGTGGRTDADNDYAAGNRLVDDGTFTYQYDDEGNRTRKTTIATGDYVEYEWDHRNRLVAVEFRTSTSTLTKKVEFDYDLFDRLIAKRVDDDGNGVFDRAQKFVYDGLEAVLVFDDSGSLTNRMLYGPAVDQFFADEDALGEVLWGLTDNLGTVRDVAEYDAGTDATTVVNHIKYDSFGNVTAESNASASPLLKFTGRYFDEDVGLQWNWQRWYDASTALWLSPDPLGFAAGDTNLYRYVKGQPTRFIDPTGLQQQEEPGRPPSVLLPLLPTPSPRIPTPGNAFGPWPGWVGVDFGPIDLIAIPGGIFPRGPSLDEVLARPVQIQFPPDVGAGVGGPNGGLVVDWSPSTNNVRTQVVLRGNIGGVTAAGSGRYDLQDEDLSLNLQMGAEIERGNLPPWLARITADRVGYAGMLRRGEWYNGAMAQWDSGLTLGAYLDSAGNPAIGISVPLDPVRGLLTEMLPQRMRYLGGFIREGSRATLLYYESDPQTGQPNLVFGPEVYWP